MRENYLQAKPKATGQFTGRGGGRALSRVIRRRRVARNFGTRKTASSRNREKTGRQKGGQYVPRLSVQKEGDRHLRGLRGRRTMRQKGGTRLGAEKDVWVEG